MRLLSCSECLTSYNSRLLESIHDKLTKHRDRENENRCKCVRLCGIQFHNPLPGGVQRRAASSGHRTRLGDATRRTPTSEAALEAAAVPKTSTSRDLRWSCRRSCWRAGGSLIPAGGRPSGGWRSGSGAPGVDHRCRWRSVWPGSSTVTAAAGST